MTLYSLGATRKSPECETHGIHRVWGFQGGHFGQKLDERVHTLLNPITVMIKRARASCHAHRKQERNDGAEQNGVTSAKVGNPHHVFFAAANDCSVVINAMIDMVDDP